MFQKHKVAFSNKDVFGNRFKPAIDACFFVVSKMLFSNKIGFDGTLDIKNEVMLSKRELWSYIYYLYYYNHTNIPEFKAMRNPENGKASGERFYDVVVNRRWNTSIVKSLDISSLVSFINDIIRKYEELVNPVFDYLKVLSKKENVNRLNILNEMKSVSGFAGVTILTGDKNGKTGFNIVTDPKEVANANVKISIVT